MQTPVNTIRTLLTWPSIRLVIIWIFGNLLLLGVALGIVLVPFGSPPLGEFSSFISFSMVLSAALLTGLCLRPDRRGILAGLLALPAGVVGFFAMQPITYPFLDHLFRTGNAIATGIVAGSMIGTLLIVSGAVKNKREFLGLGMGIIIGVGLGAIVANLSDNFPEIGTTFLFVWLSSVFFSELFGGKTNWRASLMWIMLMIISPLIAR